MPILNTIFTFYDTIISRFPTNWQLLVAAFILFMIIWSMISVLKNGHWIFVLIFIVFFPGGWPASVRVFEAIWSLIKFLLVRIQINI